MKAIEIPDAAMTAVPPVGTRLHIPFREAFLVALAAGLGYGFDAYAANLLGLLAPNIAKDLRVTVKRIGLPGSPHLVGYTIGPGGLGARPHRIDRGAAPGPSSLPSG